MKKSAIVVAMVLVAVSIFIGNSGMKSADFAPPIGFAAVSLAK